MASQIQLQATLLTLPTAKEGVRYYAVRPPVAIDNMIKVVIMVSVLSIIADNIRPGTLVWIVDIPSETGAIPIQIIRESHSEHYVSDQGDGQTGHQKRLWLYRSV